MGYLLTAAVLVGFAYFIYDRYKATRGRTPGGTGGGKDGPPRPQE
jgi:hypothetical protein